MRAIGPAVLLIVFAILTGCAAIPSQEEFVSVPDRVAAPPGTKQDFQQVKKVVTTMVGEYHKRASDKRNYEWTSTGITTLGGLAAIGGALGHKIALVNAGAGVAALSMTASSHFNFAQQSTVYIGAVRKLSCINAKISLVDDSVLRDATLSDDTAAADLAKSAAQTVSAAADMVRIEANNGILGIAPTVMTRDELIALVKTYMPPANSAAAAAGAGAGAPPPTVTPAMLRQRAAGEVVKSMLNDVAGCTK